MTRGDAGQRASHLQFPVATVPLDSRGFPANCAPNVTPHSGPLEQWHPVRGDA